MSSQSISIQSERVKGKESIVTVACCQFAPRVGDKSYNINRTLELISKAANKNANIIVLPELCNTGYVFNSREEAFALSEVIPEGETVKAWEKAAQEHNVYIVAGICEREDNNLYNSAVLIGPKGHVGTFRKLHLWYEEKLFFEPGNKGVQVFKTPLGSIGILVCYDIWFPEAHRQCTLQGADIICVPTNWVPLPDKKQGDVETAIYICIANAHVNGVYIAAADRVGVERGQPFLGNSVIVGPTGRILQGPASETEEEILVASCNLADSRRARSLNEFNHLLNDRRIDAY